MMEINGAIPQGFPKTNVTIKREIYIVSKAFGGKQHGCNRILSCQYNNVKTNLLIRDLSEL